MGGGNSRHSPVTASFLTPSAHGHGTTKPHRDVKSTIGQQDLTSTLKSSQAQAQAQAQGGQYELMGDQEKNDAVRREQEQAVKMRAWQV